MRVRDLERLSALLLQLHEESMGDGELRDAVHYVRSEVNDLIEYPSLRGWHKEGRP